MALINRLSRLFRADVHAVLDRIEEPAEVLKQAVRDMDEELSAAERRIRAAARELESLTARRDELRVRLNEIDGELDLCFASGKDDLARNLVRKKLETDRFLKRLTARHAADEKALAEAHRLFEERRATLESLRQKAEVFAGSAPGAAPESGDAAWMARELTVGEDEVDVAFLREAQARRAS
ncbi:MAG: PspA/IM30 family protein [Gammaproteobacteria bacterium]|nr:PspA/IM30 family protein [Gammaproteobacteria bacterium]MDH4256099.1 PspA/IM30 family protein [Gammaproteobacteria bacterium]MDH5310233.1 PspA/IM30 family protein [Gammaproteobacteria bacterium]